MSHHNCTFIGLHEWSTHMFEKLGWMVLARRNDDKDSIRCYIKGLRRLEKEILSKHAETVDEDRKKDLEELASNVRCLIHHAKELLH